MSLLMLLLNVLLVLVSVLAGSEDTYTLQKWEYCAGCKLSVELFLRQAAEAIRRYDMQIAKTSADTIAPLELMPIITNLCMDEHFHSFIPEMTFACGKLIEDHATVLMKFNSFETLDEQRTAVLPTKSNFYNVAKDICLDTAKACPKYMFPKTPIPQQERTLCKACAATGECMEVMKAVTVDQANSEVVENVCESLGYSHQPSAWMEEYCEEIVDENEGAIVDILNYYDYNKKVSITSELCEVLLGCSDKKKSDL